MRYYLRKPSGKHKQFRISLVKPNQATETVKHPTLANINKAYLSKTLLRNVAEKHCLDLVAQLNKKLNLHTAIFSTENQTLLERYWSTLYVRRRLVDKGSAKQALYRAITCIGELSLLSADYEALQTKLDAYQGNKQRRLCQGLNQLLAYAGRDFKLQLALPVKYKVKYLTEAELELMLPFLPNEPIKLLHQVCFYTGLRIGEAFAIEANCLSLDTVRVLEQVDRKHQLRETKNRRERFAFVPAKAMPLLKRWLLIKSSIDMATRLRMAKITRRACKLAFKNTPGKWCKFHDMRHSYAIGLVSKGVSITAVAQCLGNSVTVCEQYYVGHQLTSETVQMIKAIVG